MTDRLRLRRRGALGWAAVSVGALFGTRLRASPRRHLRPPTAVDEATFQARCIRCFRCGQVCPPGCITFDQGGLNLATLDTPTIDATERGCTLCMKCGDACPTGALLPRSARLPDVARDVRMGTPQLNKDACLAWSRQGVCRLCFHVCPLEGTAVTLVGPMMGPLFHDACVGCGLCAEACPRHVKAITLVPRP
jgi:ferredoxin-type protein NapG